ncbi:Glycosyl transferases group 1 [Nonlabens sp. Hel1_33_55]|uniref:glycosyltransferase n=1 Tax=Nonlabens sp. Hel1_33_55 TaxID=1336802 RepID=UPI000875D023|nr:glycosyltransferase [Nonlabens sp. Hel1_33_55]SCY33011.1 Glycosyl transferases group 1 [Nonlabens sp. Hel1_33_55]
MKTKGIIIVQNLIPEYRIKFFNHLKTELGESFKLYSGDQTFDQTIKHSTVLETDKSIGQTFYCGRRVMTQSLDFEIYTTQDIVVLELNPRIITTWLLLIVRKLLNRKTILWGHAWSRKGSSSRTEPLRYLMRLMATEIITYTQRQKDELKIKTPHQIIRASSNALLNKSEMRYTLQNNKALNIIYVGRLVTSKKVMNLYEAFKSIYKALPDDTKLIIVGTGPQKKELVQAVAVDQLESRVEILDVIFDNKILSKLYASSLFSVSPGYIGLNIIQSFGYGVPMIISKQEPHSPEIEAAQENENAIYYETNNNKALEKTILKVFENQDYWISKRRPIHEFCKGNYSIERMCEPFIAVLND